MRGERLDNGGFYALPSRPGKGRARSLKACLFPICNDAKLPKGKRPSVGDMTAPSRWPA